MKKRFVFLVVCILLIISSQKISATDAECNSYCQRCYGIAYSGNCLWATNPITWGSSWCHPGTTNTCDALLDGRCYCNYHILGNCPACSCNINRAGVAVDGKCSGSCGSDSQCDLKSPNSATATGNTCNACDSSCQYTAYSNQPCSTAVCTASGWDASSCSNTHKACQGTSCISVPSTTPNQPDECQTDTECGGGGGEPSCPTGDWRCSGYYEEVCNGQTYVRQNQPSLRCCTDGDCGSSNCGNLGGVWKPQAPNLDIPPANNYCCGDDAADFGKRSGNYLCVKDGETNTWIKGEEDKTSLNGALLFCNNNFMFCLDNLGNTGVSTASACQNECSYFCELNNKTWIKRGSAYPAYLYEQLKNPATDKIDKVKNNMAGKSGCCPIDWCYDGAKCVEDQTDEACDPYIYTLDSVNYRCKNGNWAASIISYDYRNVNYGFCPSAYDCFIGCGNISSNYKPDMIATDNPPQCIAANQYYLDYFCTGNQWLTRTSLIATKMANSMPSEGTFIIACGSYQDLLNEYGYLVDGKVAERFLTSNCKIHDANVPCTNNFCLAKDLDSRQLIFGTSLNGMPAPNNPLVSGSYRFDKIIGITGCSGYGAAGEPAWRYLPCQSNIFYNPDMAIVLYSNAGIGLVDNMNGWQAFNFFLKNPISSIISLVKTGQIHYLNYIDDTERKFPILNHTPAFGKTFLYQNGSKIIQGVLERDKHDPTTDITQNYMIIDYKATPNVCDYIWNFTKFTNISTCEEFNGDFTVTDSSDSLYYLMAYWQDLTIKLRMI